MPLGNEDPTVDGETYMGALRHPAFSLAGANGRGWHDRLVRWRIEVAVYAVDAADLTRRLTNGTPSRARMVEVRVVEEQEGRDARQLAELRRAVSYVPPMAAE